MICTIMSLIKRSRIHSIKAHKITEKMIFCSQISQTDKESGYQTMNVLLYDMGSYMYDDLLYFLQKAGCHCKSIYYHFPDKFKDEFFCRRFNTCLEETSYDLVISINFFPLVAELCYSHHLKYLSWCYDSPLEERLTEYFSYDTNRIFLFDRMEWEDFNRAGFRQVFHLPLAVNTLRLDSLSFSSEQIQKYTADVSLVGQIYSSPLSSLLSPASDYCRGFVEALVQSQLLLYGCYLIDDLITDELLDSMNEAYRSLGQENTVLTRRGLSFAIASQITTLERTLLLDEMSGPYDTVLYSSSKPTSLSHVRFGGSVSYLNEMPAVFRYSRINLNPALKCIRSGIPLRALDIMGSGGLLLSSWQPELAEAFSDGEELILYGSLEEAVEKADFYLKREDLRKKIAQKGYEKTDRQFSYPGQLKKMFRLSGLN